MLISASNPGATYCLTLQIAAEFCAVITDRRRMRNPVKPETAVAALRDFLRLPGISMLPTPVDVMGRFLALMERHAHVGQRIFDLYLVATMLGNRVRKIYTYIVKDFGAIDGIEVPQPM